MAFQIPLLAVAALALQSAPASAQETPTQEAEATEAQAEPADAGTEDATTSEETAGPPVEEEAQNDRDDEIICRREAVTGSRFKKKICGTRKQWEDLARRAQDDTQQMQRQGKGVEPSGP